MDSIIYKRADSEVDLKGILGLQFQNLPSNISEEEIIKEGFVTITHDLNILRLMNEKCPHIIAKFQNELIGYALCMHPSFKNDIEILRPMFLQIEDHMSQPINYIVMGQVCIAKSFRKRGILKGLYDYMQAELDDQFEATITEVDAANERSLNAHLANGFEILRKYKSVHRQWLILIKYWHKKKP